MSKTPIEGTYKITEPMLLQHDEPDACNIVRGNSPLIISGPHNGHIVPKSLYDGDRPLGLHASCFDPSSPFKRHEACDWGVADLFTALQSLETDTQQKHTYISGQYSRLICDLNRLSENSITDKSSETSAKIPGNTDLSTEEETLRLSTVYIPYHQQIKSLIEETRARFGYAIFLDLHSFTPIWNGKERPVHISTLACSDHFVEDFIGKSIGKACASHDLNFAPHEPYNLKTMQEHGAIARTIEKYGVWYSGLEIRNDLLSTPESLKNVAQLIHDTTTVLTNHHNKMVFIKAPKITIPA